MKQTHFFFSRMMGRCLLSSILLLCLLTTGAKPNKRASKKSKHEAPPEQIISEAVKPSLPNFAKAERKEPRFKDAFEVGVYFIDFPDTLPIQPNQTLKELTTGVEDYFRTYTQNLCWPTFKILGRPYRAPRPLGYYTRYDDLNNKIGWNDKDEGMNRLNELRSAALRSVQQGKLPPVTTLVYATQRKPIKDLAKISELRSCYREAYVTDWGTEYPDQLNFYQPASTIRWADPLWPNSSIILSETSGPGTFIHELGHVLGAPDSYRAPEIDGGVNGTPVTVGGGPTAPLYCRWKHCGTLPDEAYPIITTNTTLTLSPRWSHYQKGVTNPLGVFIPTVHPHYILHLEFEPNKPQILRENSENEYGRYGSSQRVEGGIYIYYINITQTSSYPGHPDLCYTYRPNDPTMRGLVSGAAIFREGDAFDQTSNPKNMLPNELPTGVEIIFGEQTLEGATISIKVPTQKVNGVTLKNSLLPIIKMKEITDIQPTTCIVETDLTFRGEPHAIERGVVYGNAPHPTLPRSKSVQIHGYGFDKARIIDLRPGSTVYVRAYAKNENGITYSKEEQKILLPKPSKNMDVAPLLIDHYSATSNWLTKYLNRAINNGVHGNATSMIALLKIMAYRRAPLDGSKPKKKDPFNYNRLHLHPHENRYPPTVTDTLSARDTAEALAHELGLFESKIPDDLEKRITKHLKYPAKPRKGKEVVVNLEIANEDVHLNRIHETLLKGWPVLCVRQSALTSSPIYAIDVCIIDGYRNGENGIELHIVYPTHYDRLPKTQRVTGWHPPSALTEGIVETGARLIFLERSSSPF